MRFGASWHGLGHLMSEAYGPREGDVITLGGSGLRLHIDDRVPDVGDEFRVGFAKTGRDGIALKAVATRESCDVLISNVVVLDPIDGVRVASIGIREGRISGIGRAGNPDTSDDVDIVVGTGTVVIEGDGLIATPGGIDTHVHTLSPRVFEAEIASGVTTVIGQEAGPVWGVGLGSRWVLDRALTAMDRYPVNVGLLGRGSASRDASLREALGGHVCGFKVHEDTGATPTSIDTALTIAEEFDVQVAIHTDTLNEAMSVLDTVAVADGRVFHAYHVEGCGGGHAPDVLRLAGRSAVLASSTNPTLPFGRNALHEHRDMILLCHGMNPDRAADRHIAEARVRAATMAGENVLHDLGVIPVTSSDAQGMGRAGETWWRTFALAAVMASADPDRGPHDNDRILRYLSKITINPALVHGLAHEVGRIASGWLADIVLWTPASFAAKPQLVVKGGFPAWGVTGDPNASIDSAQPLVLGPQYGAYAPGDLAVLFTNAHALAEGAAPMARRAVAVRGCRSIRGEHMVRHGVLADVEVPIDGSPATADGRPLVMDPVAHAPLSRLHFW